MSMFEKILIANRGEIACRVIRTARRMGIKTVAVYSEADTNAAHVSMADEAVFIGPSPASESYLDIRRLLSAIDASGAQAVHPGYGFLSENELFCRAVERAGVTFIGPPSKAIRQMGDKIAAKKLAMDANVATVPGYMGVIGDVAEAKKIAADIGYPVMIKAAAGGGGKGMRAVHSEEEVAQAFSSAMNEAKNSFRDDRIFIEKFIDKPRHIEIQLIGDKHGNIVSLGERECSIQRHHQKVIEEAPSPFVDEKTRQAMYKQCISLARSVNYFSAGTVEFMMDSKKNFYFLEMNTRLQVEHPVTEMVTGLDLVEQMIRVAAGETLSFSQEDVTLNGWAIESRIYAEDPTRGFLPSTGRISEYQEPESSDEVRIDSGVYEGGQVSMFYDAMIAKLTTFGNDRQAALATMQRALGQFVIHGISHNISFLEALMAHSRFASGDINTNFIEEEYPDGFFGAQITSEITRNCLAVAVYVFLEDARRAGTITGQLAGRERHVGNRWIVTIDEESFPIYVKLADGGSGYEIRHDAEILTVESNWVLGNRLFHGMVNGEPVNVQLELFAGGYFLTHAGAKVRTTVRSTRVAELDKFMPSVEDSASSTKVEAPISGLIVDIKVSEGDTVKTGGELVILEAMKMENIICTQRDCIIKKIHIDKNQNVAYGQLIIEFEE